MSLALVSKWIWSLPSQNSPLQDRTKVKVREDRGENKTYNMDELIYWHSWLESEYSYPDKKCLFLCMGGKEGRHKGREL